MPIRNLVVIILAAVVSLACYEKAQRNRYASTVVEAMDIIHSNYVDDVELRGLFESAMDGMVQSLDPYSGFISPDDFRRFQQDLDQEFGGIGIVVEMNRESRRLTILSPLVDTPAYRKGLRAGDEIIAIGGTATTDVPLKDAVELIQGKPGTTVTLTIARADEEPFDVVIERAKIPVKSVLGDTRREDGSWKFYLEEHPRIGYIRLTSFGEMTVSELRSALESYDEHPIEGLILDLRNNAGGLLKAGVITCDMFVDDGKIVSTRGRGGIIREEFRASSGTLVPTDLPIVVLINRFSASASEIVAACLQDHGRAVIIGERSWGKGTVQNVIEMEGGKSALKLTTARYSRPSGENIHRQEGQDEDEAWGVRPNDGFDVTLTDKQFERVLEYRRDRDIFRTTPPPPEDPDSDPPEDAASESPPENEPSESQPPSVPGPQEEEPDEEESDDDPEDDDSIVDPQLQKAVDYLQAQFSSATSP